MIKQEMKGTVVVDKTMMFDERRGDHNAAQTK